LDQAAKMDPITLGLAEKLNLITLSLVVKLDLIIFGMTAKKFKSCWIWLGSRILGMETRSNVKRKKIQPNPISNEKKIIITQLLYNIKKVSSIYFLFIV
jgi:hypothetical protein